MILGIGSSWNYRSNAQLYYQYFNCPLGTLWTYGEWEDTPNGRNGPRAKKEVTTSENDFDHQIYRNNSSFLQHPEHYKEYM